MRVVYVGGPLKAPTHWQQEQNIRVAEESSLLIWKMGAAAICPHTMSRFFMGEGDENHWMAGDLEILRRSDAMFVCPGWHASEGTKREVALAVSLPIPIFFSLERLREWITREANNRAEL